MAVEAYMAMELMIAREVAGKSPCILNIGAFNGGITNNIVCDYAKLFLTNRTHSDELTEFVERRIREICENVAKTAGGRAVVTRTKLLPYVVNHPQVSKLMVSAAQKVVGAENVKEQNRTMGGEDFSFLCRKKPGCMFRLGINNPANPDTQVSLHNDHFDVDEHCFDIGIPVFVNFVLDNQDGIELAPINAV
jgi:amidohydrolase